jgi:hypothetical protein
MTISMVTLTRLCCGWYWTIHSDVCQVDSGQDIETLEEAAQTALAAARCADANGCQPRRQVRAFDPSNGWCECLRCGHRWHTREYNRNHHRAPVRCSKCRSPLWNKPRIRKVSRAAPAACEK